jgi:hypothetical protein
MIKMSKIELIQRFICPSCASDDELIECFDSVERVYDERVDQEIIEIVDQDRVIRLMISELAQHKQDEDDDVEIECYI